MRALSATAAVLLCGSVAFAVGCDRDPDYRDLLGVTGGSGGTTPIPTFVPKPAPSPDQGGTTPPTLVLENLTVCANEVPVPAEWLGSTGALARHDDVLYVADARGVTAYALADDCPGAAPTGTSPAPLANVRSAAFLGDLFLAGDADGFSGVGRFDPRDDSNGTCGQVGARTVAVVADGTVLASTSGGAIVETCGQPDPASVAGAPFSLAVGSSSQGNAVWVASGDTPQLQRFDLANGTLTADGPALGGDGTICTADVIVESGRQLAVVDRACSRTATYSIDGSGAARATDATLGAPRSVYATSDAFVFVFVVASGDGATLRFAKAPPLPAP